MEETPNNRKSKLFEIIDKEVSNINIETASIKTLSVDNFDEFYAESGNQFILNKINKLIATASPNLVFFEHSYFASTIENNRNTIFICVCSKSQLSNEGLQNFHHFFSEILPNVFEKKYPVLWHKNFAVKPVQPLFYLSTKKGLSKKKSIKTLITNSKSISAHLVQNIQHKEMESLNVYLGNYTLLHHNFENLRESILRNEERSDLADNNKKLREAYDIVFEKKENEYS